LSLNGALSFSSSAEESSLGFGSVVAALAEDAPIVLDIDATLFIHVALFAVLWLVLKPVLFEPVLKLFEEREKRIEGARREARSIDEASMAAERTFEEAVAKARAEAQRERDAIRLEATKTEAEIVDGAKAEVSRALEDGRKRIASKAEAARQALSKEVPQLAREIATRALGREVVS
jgi:F-type H+-transporting ATPase subunit b